MIELRGITQHYGVRPILKDINLLVPQGELVALVGPNGMGKSTLLGVMARSGLSLKPKILARSPGA